MIDINLQKIISIVLKFAEQGLTNQKQDTIDGQSSIKGQSHQVPVFMLGSRIFFY